MARFTQAEWNKITNELNSHQIASEPYGLPARRRDSLILSSFNIRALGAPETRTPQKDKGRTKGAWAFLSDYVSRCDFVAIQEVKDNLGGLLRLKDSLKDADKYALVVSDVTGAKPTKDTTQERLAFLYRWDRIERTELASDITFDRRAILETIHSKWQDFTDDFKAHDKLLKEHRRKLREHEQGLGSGKKPPPPTFVISNFLTFIRTPHVASFRIKWPGGGQTLPFHAVNAHLLYGNKSRSAEERKMEFDALVDWLRWRTKSSKRLYHQNIILFGDMNLEFEKRFTDENDADQAIKDMNKDVGRGYKVNFPFLDVPKKRGPAGNNKGRFTSTARMTETYDQIGLFGHKGALPIHDENENAGMNGTNGFDYGVFAFADLFAKALHNAPSFHAAPNPKSFVKRFEHDVSDHHPIWVRLPKPGT
jgi:endonuclease/exonuclease/phosphatase family metal-dependent hydrolase